MKLSLVIGFSAVVLVANARGATYMSNFDSFDDQLDVAGNDGWVINDPTVGLSFIVDMDGSKAAALGGYFADPASTATVALTHSYGHFLGDTSMSFDFTLVDSTDLYPMRDTFGVTLRNGADNLITVYFSPDSQSLTPDSGPDAQWNLYYGVGDSTDLVFLTLGVFELGYYSFDLKFTPNGATTDFNLTVAGLTPEVRTGNIAIDPTTVATDFGLIWTPTDSASPADAGDNYFVMDNLAVIPEASTPLLLCLAGLGAVSRRRRSH